MDKIYNMTFEEVIKEIFETKGAYQGAEFKDGVFIEADDDVICIKEYTKEKTPALTIGLFYVSRGTLEMKYRRVLTRMDILRRH